MIVFLGAVFLAQPATLIFTNDSRVVSYSVMYLRIMAFTSCAFYYYSWISQSLNAAGMPFSSLKINIIGSFLFMVPLGFLGSKVYGFNGLILGLAAGQVLTAFFAFREGHKKLHVPVGSIPVKLH